MKIAVYCASEFGKEELYTEAARELGQWIGASKHTLVYGGGESGLMGTVAKEVHDAGCEVIGVVPGNVAFIKIFTEDMSERKRKMLELADVFIALPGGMGTLDEISETITLTKIGVFHKPSILFNRNGFYEPLKQMFQTMEDAGFLAEDKMKHVLFSDDLKEMEGFLREWL